MITRSYQKVLLPLPSGKERHNLMVSMLGDVCMGGCIERMQQHACRKNLKLCCCALMRSGRCENCQVFFFQHAMKTIFGTTTSIHSHCARHIRRFPTSLRGAQVVWAAAIEGSSIQELMLAAAQSGGQIPQSLEQLRLLQSGRAVALMPDIEVGIAASVSP